MLDGLNKKMNEWWDELGKFSNSHWATILLVCILVAAGGLVAAIFGWVFALIVPLWLLLVAYAAKRRIKKLEK